MQNYTLKDLAKKYKKMSRKRGYKGWYEATKGSKQSKGATEITDAGNVPYNNAFFNQAMGSINPSINISGVGTADGGIGVVSSAPVGGGAMGESLNSNASLDEIKEVISKYYKIKSQPVSGQSYILPDGDFVELNEDSHESVEAIFVEAGWREEIEYNNSLDYNLTLVDDYNCIRISDGDTLGTNPYIMLPKNTLTSNQYNSLENWLWDINSKYDVIYIGSAFNKHEGQEYSFGDYLPNEIIKKIKRFYSSGQLYENKNLNINWSNALNRLCQDRWGGDKEQMDKDIQKMLKEGKYINSKDTDRILNIVMDIDPNIDDDVDSDDIYHEDAYIIRLDGDGRVWDEDLWDPSYKDVFEKVKKAIEDEADRVWGKKDLREDIKPEELDAVKLQHLSDDEILEDLENASVGSKIRNIGNREDSFAYRTYGNKECRVEKHGGYKSNAHIAPSWTSGMNVKDRNEIQGQRTWWTLNGSEKHNYDLLRIIKGKDKYYKVTDFDRLNESDITSIATEFVPVKNRKGGLSTHQLDYNSTIGNEVEKMNKKYSLKECINFYKSKSNKSLKEDYLESVVDTLVDKYSIYYHPVEREKIKAEIINLTGNADVAKEVIDELDINYDKVVNEDFKDDYKSLQAYGRSKFIVYYGDDPRDLAETKPMSQTRAEAKAEKLKDAYPIVQVLEESTQITKLKKKSLKEAAKGDLVDSQIRRMADMLKANGYYPEIDWKEKTITVPYRGVRANNEKDNLGFIKHAKYRANVYAPIEYTEKDNSCILTFGDYGNNLNESSWDEYTKKYVEDIAKRVKYFDEVIKELKKSGKESIDSYFEIERRFDNDYFWKQLKKKLDSKGIDVVIKTKNTDDKYWNEYDLIIKKKSLDEKVYRDGKPVTDVLEYVLDDDTDKKIEIIFDAGYYWGALYDDIEEGKFDTIKGINKGALTIINPEESHFYTQEDVDKDLEDFFKLVDEYYKKALKDGYGKKNESLNEAKKPTRKESDEKMKELLKQFSDELKESNSEPTDTEVELEIKFDTYNFWNELREEARKNNIRLTIKEKHREDDWAYYYLILKKYFKDEPLNEDIAEDNWDYVSFANMYSKGDYRIWDEGDKIYLDRITGMRSSTPLGSYSTVQQAKDVVAELERRGLRGTGDDVRRLKKELNIVSESYPRTPDQFTDEEYVEYLINNKGWSEESARRFVKSSRKDDLNESIHNKNGYTIFNDVTYRWKDDTNSDFEYYDFTSGLSDYLRDKMYDEDLQYFKIVPNMIEGKVGSDIDLQIEYQSPEILLGSNEYPFEDVYTGTVLDYIEDEDRKYFNSVNKAMKEELKKVEELLPEVAKDWGFRKRR